MLNLKQLDKKELTEIIQCFGKNKKIFQSEAQFQFDLAWELKKQYDCEVKLEDMRACIKDGEKYKKKFYTDIVLEKDGYSVAIELKYKTAGYGYLLNHGAVDLGRYDYLWDVHRLELLLGKGNERELLIEEDHKEGEVGDSWKEKWKNIDVLKKCNKGFAVLLTNEKKYWEQSYEDGKDSIDDQFKIGEETKKIKNTDLDWKKDDAKYPKNYNNYPSTVTNKDKPTERAQPIHLSKQYAYKWKDYCELPNDEGIFRFVIIEV